MKLRNVIIAIVVALAACTNEEAARRALEGAGYTDITFHGHAFAECSDDDSSCTAFEARGPNGHRVSGAVGCGFGCGKGCTIRTR